MKIILHAYLLFFCTSIFAQNAPIDTDNIQAQIDSIRNEATQKGFKVLKEAVLNMDNQYDTPIISELKSKNIYKFVFISQPNVKLLELRMYDQTDKLITYIKQQPKFSDPNIIVFDYVAQFSQYYMTRVVQAHPSKKNQTIGRLCSTVSI